jgi:hypothetical protein
MAGGVRVEFGEKVVSKHPGIRKLLLGLLTKCGGASRG